MRKWFLVALAATPLALAPQPVLAGSGPHPEVIPGTGTRAPAQVIGLQEKAGGGDAVRAARAHLAERRSRYAVDPADLTPLGTVRDGKDETVRFAQRHRGVPVLGAQYLVHMRGAEGGRTVTGVGGRYLTGLTVGTTPRLSQPAAVERARQFVRDGQRGPRTGRNGKNGKTAEPAMEATPHGLVVLPRGRGVLTQHVTVRTTDPVRRRPVRREMYLDARAGFPVLDYDGIAYDGPGERGTGANLHTKTVPLEITKTDDGKYQLRDVSRAMNGTAGGTITTWDAIGRDVGEVSGRWPDGLKEISSGTTRFEGTATGSGAVDAHWAAGQVYEFYRRRLGRDSLDGRGGTINSLVGVTYLGIPYVNAFWDGQKMVYGGGDEEYFPLSADPDVVGHEMTHGVVENTANLLYINQSGAINEAVADYFGNAIDVTVSGMPTTHRDAGLVGENLCRTKTPRQCAFRDLNDGRTTRDYVGVSANADSGGVHLNSTIFSGALWDLRERLGDKKADKLVYKALSEYMTPLDTFVDGRGAVLAAARALGIDRRVVERAFDAHGIKRGWERVLGKDSATLLPDVTAAYSGPNAAGGWWVTSNSNEDGSEAPSVYAGRTDRRGNPIRLSPNDGRFHVYPATDGKTVVWAAYGATDVKIMSRPLKGGPVKVVGGAGATVSELTVDNGDYAWQVTHPSWGARVLLLRKGQTNPELVDGGAPPSRSYFPHLYGGRLAYLKQWQKAEGGTGWSPIVRDLASGAEKAIHVNDPWTALGGPKLTQRGVFWLEDQAPERTGTGLFRASFDGSNRRTLIAENDRKAPTAYGIDATRDWVTFDHWPRFDGTNASTPKVFQLPAGGGKPVPVSCAKGMQPWFDADTGRRVVWLDGSAARTDLVTRQRPPSRC